MTTRLVAPALILLLVALPRCTRDDAAVPAAGAACTCAAAKLVNGWCDSCGVGYVAGVAIPSADLHEYLDPHGHDIDAPTIACPSCRAAIPHDGFCDACDHGFVGGRLYFSRLTYALAHGDLIDPETTACATCRRHAAGTGWCDGCRRGMVGSVAFSDRTALDRAVPEYERLLTSIAELRRCETCAILVLADGKCPRCGRVYRDGRPVAIP